ncbi:Signal transduction histidine kinase [Marivirga sericea]|uniref:histidine kinase n=1 Tax=Marivirga sericea TaxID=1028 RepID=A0A1X7I5T7_9BACT|nr:tetratricopeptide repeat-containing sensor histidine kinase [Marivirga sericea]SMG09383.1 Signal transduction histidine kinase [Marivirga sericea]
MKLACSILLISCLHLNFDSDARQLTNYQDSTVQALNKLRYNYPDSALAFVEAEIKNTTDLKTRYYTELLFTKSAIQYIQSNYLASRNSYKELHDISKEIGSDLGIARALNGRGLIYLGRELYEEALIEFIKSLEVNRSINNQKNVTVNLLNIGICYQELGKLDQAYHSYQASLKSSIQYDWKTYTLMNMNRLGVLFLEKDQLDSAEYYLTGVKNQKPNNWEKSYNLSGLTELHIKKSNYKKAVQYGLQSFELAKKIGAKWDVAEVALKLSDAYEQLNALDYALKYHKLHKAYSDSLLNEEMNREINWAELQVTKAENEQLIVQKDLLSSVRDRNQLIIALLSTIVISLVFLALLYRRHIKQKDKYNQNLGSINKQLAEKKILIEKQNKDLLQINNTKNRLFSILSHDLRSPINSLKQLLDVRNNISEDDIKKYMDRLQHEVGKVNEQVNSLLNWANTQMDGFKTSPKTVQLDHIVTQNLNSLTYIAQEKGVTLQHNPLESLINIDPGQLNIIITNLLGNSIKYTSDGDSIEISYSQNEKFILLHIKDSGIGMDEATLQNLKGELNERSFSRKGTGMETGTGLGMLLVKQFLTFNNSSITIESEENKGTLFVLTFPKAKEDH